MVFLYNRLYRPLITDVQAIPSGIRRLMIKARNRFSKPIHPSKEPLQPSIKEQNPGKNLKNYLNDLHLITTNAQSVVTAVDLNRSYGNFVTDIDGNVLLDLFGHRGVNLLGYNNADLIKATQTQSFNRAFVSPTQPSSLMTENTFNEIVKFRNRMSPVGLSSLRLVRGEVNSVNLALNSALSSASSIVICPYRPEYNGTSDEVALAAVEKHIKNTSAHAIIKPDFSRSQLFYDNLIGLLSSKHINYVIDESESALLTGQNWAHEVLMPHAKPLAVTFSGPTRISGYFHLGDLALNSTSFDVSVDSTKLQLFNLEHDVVLRDGLLKSANKAGLEILEELNLKLGKNYRTVGEGAYLDIICPTKEKAVELQDAFLKSGILVGHYANRVLIRASLTIGSRHVAIISRFVENLKL